jgi:hypothetical protein
MRLGCVVKYFFIFLGVQVAIDIFFLIMPLEIRKPFFERFYNIWLYLGETVFPSGPGGHAMAGGAILGFFIGVFVYSLVPALIVCFFKSRNDEA